MSLPHENWVVLIVDDNYDNVVVAQTALEFYGAEVHVAPDGREGLAFLQEKVPTVILLDLSMPVMNGYEMIKQLRQMPEYVAIPVIAVTAYAMKADRAKALDAGFDDYVSKPYDILHLMSVMEDAIVRKQAGD